MTIILLDPLKKRLSNNNCKSEKSAFTFHSLQFIILIVTTLSYVKSGKIIMAEKEILTLDNVTFEFLRCCRGYTNSEVAKKAGISATTIYKLRQGSTHFPSLKTLMKVFDAFDYCIEFHKSGAVKRVSKKSVKVASNVVRLKDRAAVAVA